MWNEWLIFREFQFLTDIPRRWRLIFRPSCTHLLHTVVYIRACQRSSHNVASQLDCDTQTHTHSENSLTIHNPMVRHSHWTQPMAHFMCITGECVALYHVHGMVLVPHCIIRRYRNRRCNKPVQLLLPQTLPCKSNINSRNLQNTHRTSSPNVNC